MSSTRVLSTSANMSHPDEYSESHRVIQEHHAWVEEKSVPALVDPTSDETHPFLPEATLQAHFDTTCGRNPSLSRLLCAVFPNSRPITIEDIAPEYSKVFCTLLEIGFACYIEHFVLHDSLRDQCLPFNAKHQPHGFPKCARDAQFFAKFCAAQWKFCVPKLEGKGKKKFDQECILPFISRRFLGRGGSAEINLLEIQADYNCLYRLGGDGVSSAHPSTNIVAVKSYRGEDARSAFEAEGSAFLKLGKKTGGGIIGYHGSYTQGDKFHVLLEYADGGTLEDFFRNNHPPTEKRDIVLFWESIFKLIEGLSRIHNDGGQTPADGGPIQGWHQDVKPANVLVSSLSGHKTSPYTYEFMLADLGLSHFKKKTLTTSAKGTLAPDSRGTKTYGAPECHGFDHLQTQITFPVNSKVDVWSLGCILSEAAVWVVFSYKGLLEYREERRAETSRVPGFEYGECFHNGENLLETVHGWHAAVSKEHRKSDVVTSKGLHLIEFMMEADPDARATSKQALKQSHDIIVKARLKLDNELWSSDSQKKLKAPSTISPDSDYSKATKEETPVKSNFPSPPTHAGPAPLFDDRHVHSPDEMSEASSRDASVMYATPTGQQSSRVDPRRSQVQPVNRQSLVESLGMSQQQNERRDTFGSIPEVEHSEVNGYMPNGDAVGHNYGTNQPGQANRVVSDPPPPRTRNSTFGQSINSNHLYSHSVPSTPIVGNQANGQNFQPMNVISSNRMPITTGGHVSYPLTLPLRQNNEEEHPPSRPERAPYHSIEAVSDPSRQPATASRAKSPVRVPKLPFLVAMKWHKDKKNRVPNLSPLPDDWLLESKLKKRDHLFIVDDSQSMARYWNEVEPLFSILAYILKTADPDGLDLHFTMSDEVYNERHSSKLVKTIRDRRPRGESNIRLRLGAILSEYTSKLNNQKSFRDGGSLWARKKDVRPLNIYVFTDGVWQHRTDAKPAIINLVTSLHELGLDENQIGIQFISFGHDPTGLARLKELDELDKTHKLPLDIVDTTPSTGDNLWKMLLGAIDKDFDEGD